MKALLNPIKDIYDKKYKLLMLITILMLVGGLLVLGFWKVNTGEFVDKDITLTGGTQVSIKSADTLDTFELKDKLDAKFGEVNVKELASLSSGGNTGYIFEFSDEVDIDSILPAIREATGLELEDGSYNVQNLSPALSESFWQSTIKAMIFAFIVMGIVVFIYFRVPIPSLAVILAAGSDLILTMAAMNLLGIKLSIAGVAALLMLLGYSVDTDILLSTKVLKRHEGVVLDRVYSAMKTGFTMSLSVIVTLASILVIRPPEVLVEIALILIIGLLFDIPNTWLQNAGILRWYAEKKKIE